MKDGQLFDMLYKDRVESLEHVNVSWIKKNGIDLLIKQIILMYNCIGKKSTGIEYLFIDEIKNNNMQNNLMKTKSIFDKHNEKTATLTYHHINRIDHYKLGYVQPIGDLIITSIVTLSVIILGIFGKLQITKSIRYLYSRYIKMSFDSKELKEIYLMTDHHFFSSIIATSVPEKCAVLQHGLIMDKRFYYPIRAGKFCAWGHKSKELQHNDPKVCVTGTYKFSNLTKITDSGSNRIMFLIGSLNDEQVKRKIDILLNIKKTENFDLVIKCHPGSLFDKGTWETIYSGNNITFYKEELIQDIDFNIAISENSTAIMDLIALNKPFVLFDNIDGYFSDYANIIPHGNTEKEIADIISNLDKYDFITIMNEVREKELNWGKCKIYEMRRV